MINKHLKNIQFGSNPRITNLKSGVIINQQTDKYFKKFIVRRSPMEWFYISKKVNNLNII